MKLTTFNNIFGDGEPVVIVRREDGFELNLTLEQFKNLILYNDTEGPLSWAPSVKERSMKCVRMTDIRPTSGDINLVFELSEFLRARNLHVTHGKSHIEISKHNYPENKVIARGYMI